MPSWAPLSRLCARPRASLKPHRPPPRPTGAAGFFVARASIMILLTTTSPSRCLTKHVPRGVPSGAASRHRRWCARRLPTARNSAVPSPRLAEAVAVHGHLRPHETALICADRTISYGALSELTQAFRQHLLELELPAGSTVCVPAHKTPETIALLLAAFLEGLVVLAPAPDLGAAALARLAQQARATHSHRVHGRCPDRGPGATRRAGSSGIRDRGSEDARTCCSPPQARPVRRRSCQSQRLASTPSPPGPRPSFPLPPRILRSPTRPSTSISHSSTSGRSCNWVHKSSWSTKAERPTDRTSKVWSQATTSPSSKACRCSIASWSKPVRRSPPSAR